ncbi:hypothetical protein TWF696_005550 [Orbilia brochopaga]|uniref:F-box domain-containing protein n=1 Tax=Orbilia brochopaga TaxID=3140254 RepID=A0AAV9V131_9PEZI
MNSRPLYLLDLPPEILLMIVRRMPRRDVKNLVLTGSKAYKIAAPILYRALRLHFDLCNYREGLRVEEVESVLDTAAATLNFVKCFHVDVSSTELHGFNAGRRDNGGVRRDRLIGKDDIAIQLILRRIPDGQLECIDFPHNTSTRTLVWILAHQKNLKYLQFGDIPAQASMELPENKQVLNMCPGPLHLKSLKFASIDMRIVRPMFNLLRGSENSLRKLSIGPTECYIYPLFYSWQQVQYLDPSGTVRSIDNLKNSLPKLDLHSLEQLEVIHDDSCGELIPVFDHAVEDFTSLKRFKLIRCTNSINILRRIFEDATNLKSLQVIYSETCHEIGKALPSIHALHTLQLISSPISCSDFRQIKYQQHSLKRLWLESTHDCTTEVCPSQMVDFHNTRKPGIFHSALWPCLEELAIGIGDPAKTDAWTRIPMISTVKVLRLLALSWESIDEDICCSTVAFYARYLRLEIRRTVQRPPALQVVILSGLSNAIHRRENPTPLYFIVNDGEGTSMEEIPRIVRLATYSEALNACRAHGSTPYLLCRTAQELHTIWEDAKDGGA